MTNIAIMSLCVTSNLADIGENAGNVAYEETLR
jgi:hypothetical protein